MHSTVFVAIILILIELISGVHGGNATVIGSSAVGIIFLILLILDLVAIVELIMSSGRDVCSKIIWILIVLFFPIGGLILYWCCARNHNVNQSL